MQAVHRVVAEWGAMGQLSASWKSLRIFHDRYDAEVVAHAKSLEPTEEERLVRPSRPAAPACSNLAKKFLFVP